MGEISGNRIRNKRKAIPIGIALLVTAVIVLLVAAFLVEGMEKKNEEVKTMKLERNEYHNELFGPNVFIFSPEDSAEEVSTILRDLWEKQETNQFGEERYGVYFLPGEYDSQISVMVGYYMEICGLGRSPLDTSLSRLNCNATWLGDDSNHNACCNFWRGVSNLSITSDTMWAVSQATFMRRVFIDGNLALHDNYGWASGGFLANSKIDGVVDSGSQQQWLSRNCDWNLWTGKNWNMVFVGMEAGDAPKGNWPGLPYTTVEQSPLIGEKPYLMVDEKEGYGVFVPAIKEDSMGHDWEEAGNFIPIDEFYVAHPEMDTTESINKALEEGKNLLLTPGIYHLEDAIKVDNDNAVILGMGFATLVPENGTACMEITADKGVRMGGVLFDAGAIESEVLLQIGEKTTEKVEDKNWNVEDTMCFSDLFFRVGGTGGYAAKAKNCVSLYSDHVIGDNFWIWRADHGDEVAWDKNTCANGILVEGNEVTMYALMVEHFQEYQTIWNGEGGRVYFYQSEIPYDVPEQDVWKSHEGAVNGYASYKVGEQVTEHEAYGVGIYSYHRDARVDLYSAMEIPEREGVRIHNICAIMITGNPGISHVINEQGEACNVAGDRKIIVEYENGIQK